MVERPWQDESVLRELYEIEGLDQYEIADRLDCSQVTISKWFKKHDISTGFEHVEKLRDEDWLRTEYVEKGKSQHQIAEELECAQMSVSRWCHKHGIETAKANYEKHGSFHQHDGYEYFRSSGEGILIHRLVMVAECGMEALRGNDVHHQNGVRWDNRPENLQLMDRGEHISHHRQKQISSADVEEYPWRDEERLHELYIEQNLSQRQIADELGCTISSVNKWLHEHGIEVSTDLLA